MCYSVMMLETMLEIILQEIKKSNFLAMTNYFYEFLLLNYHLHLINRFNFYQGIYFFLIYED